MKFYTIVTPDFYSEEDGLLIESFPTEIAKDFSDAENLAIEYLERKPSEVVTVLAIETVASYGAEVHVSQLPDPLPEG